ncbi:glutaminyl-peptide cyclotransferase [Dyadobacter sp. CY347]|uniref:glutaminyl-peptide cyclotransferase n=1 Tax=Dyadobacter sp. CY347 TaxID=2909336 RepID=UPI001F27F080|nr:glutaminyl-peptide cyclotransferase [Dyadobacter sp. CY347]MCF2491693.1 glutaminyl-peptide cyclotransferase [Dyadobacter sp. CY347]
MKKIGFCLPFIFICCWLAQSCEKKRESSKTEKHVRSAIATLSEPSYVSNDTISIKLSEPLDRLDVMLDDKRIQAFQSDTLTVLIPTNTSKVGFYQLIISGLHASKGGISDTLFVEIRSDIKPRHLQYQLSTTYPHATTSFTQGLEFYGGALYEGTGQHGQSRLMRVEPTTGIIMQSKDLPIEHFGEGITIVNDKIYQLTWKSGQCFRYTMGLEVDKTFRYYTQGWGLTHKDTTLIVSDGSNRLYFYTPDFKPLGGLSVYDDKGAVSKLNELEYVDGYVLANVWETNRIVQVDLESGKVVGELNLTSLVPKNLIDPQSDVLNGIAYNHGEHALYVTGKNWPALYKLTVKDLFKVKINDLAL